MADSISVYSEDYFNTLNYTDYLQRKDRYSKLAKELTDVLDCLGFVNKHSRIMDYGCAVGFLAESLMELGFKNVYGYDISEWACRIAKSRGINLYESVIDDHFDILFFLDVLEHIPIDEIEHIVSTFTSDIIIARIPISTNGGMNFHLEVSNKDKTHITCKEKEWWSELFHSNGYPIIKPLNLYTIWDSVGVFSFIALRD